jgi:hypothetical protein
VGRELEGDHGLDKPLLRAVVEVALHLPPRRVGRGHDASPGRDKLGAMIRVGDSTGRKFRELPQPGLCVRRR